MDNIAKIIDTHIADIQAGDTIMHQGKEKTVGRSNIKSDIFMGTSLFGDTYKSGHEPVKKIVYKKFIRGMRVV